MKKKSNEQPELNDEWKEVEIEDDYNRRWEKWFDELSTEQKKEWRKALARVADVGGDAELLELERRWGAPEMPEDLIEAVEAIEEYLNDFGEP